MRVMITGASGFIGAALTAALREAGHEPVALRRGNGGAGPRWSVDEGWIDEGALDEVDAVVHLAGEPISPRFTSAKKREILSSRTAGTALIARSVVEAGVPILVSGSAVGYYGDRGDELLTEDSAAGTGFLAGVVEAWEEATVPAVEAGVRTVLLRTSLVLGDSGGLLGRMLLPYKLGVGGRVGHGSQYWSWIALDDVVGAIMHALTDESVSGPLNLSAPNPVPNREFVEVLGRVLRRPTIIPAPAPLLGLLFGRQATDELLMASQRAVPTRLLAAGYEFRLPELEPALRAAIG